MSVKDGGRAFPGPRVVEIGGVVMEAEAPHGGMSLRDYFAGQIIVGIQTCCGITPTAREAMAREAERNGVAFVQQMAAEAYLLADAMLAEREKEVP